MRLLYGVELNILNEQGAVDLKDELLSSLDYAIISIHPPIFTPWAHKDLTDAYLAAMNHPKVRFLGHIDDARFPSDFHRLLRAAKERGIYPLTSYPLITPILREGITETSNEAIILF